MKLVIDRTRWLRGEKDSFLLRELDDKMCCLGFYCIARELLEEDIEDKSDPSEVVETIKLNKHHPKNKIKDLITPLYGQESWNKTEILAWDNNYVCKKLMGVNDDDEITENEREKEIAGLFTSINTEVEFIN